MDFYHIKTFKSGRKLQGEYKCSQKLYDWQRRAINSQNVSPITVVLDHEEMTASIPKVEIARYISVARKVISDWRTK